MSGLRFESAADMPPRMRELYARQRRPEAADAASKATKYHSQPTERAGVRFASQKEARRYDELMTMLRRGIITDLRLQPQFTLQESYVTETGGAGPRDSVHGRLFLPPRRAARRGGCKVQGDADKGVSAQPQVHAGKIRDRHPGGIA